MNEYLLMTGIALVAVWGVDRQLKTRLYLDKKFWEFEGVIVGLTVLVDSYLASKPIEVFQPEILSGITIGRSPLENVLFGIAWMWLNVVLFEYFKAKK